MKRLKMILSSVLRVLYLKIIQEKRLRELERRIVLYLSDGDSVLDVGCGSGTLARKIIESPGCPTRVNVTGLENLKRSDEVIPVEYYNGRKIPYPDDAFDIVLLCDVLHHESNPHNLMAECARVARRLLIIKDHHLVGFLARQRIALLDWAGNLPYGIPCLYRYNTKQEWKLWYKRHGLVVDHELHSLQIYPSVLNFLFGKHLHYLAVLRTDSV